MMQMYICNKCQKCVYKWEVTITCVELQKYLFIHMHGKRAGSWTDMNINYPWVHLGASFYCFLFMCISESFKVKCITFYGGKAIKFYKNIFR